ncbi:MAG: DUF4097 family beta strand repeat-containing protein [Bacteroidota bacterium]
MNQHYFKPGLVLILMLASATVLNAQSLKKDFHKEYQAGASTELCIENQFGNVIVQEWDQNKILIDVNVEVSAEKEDIAQKLLDRIVVNFKEEGNKFSAITDMKNEESVKGKNVEFHINYTVKCPKNLNLSVENQFGDVSLGSLTGPVDLEVQFGSINAVSLTGTETNIEIQFGKATINELKNASVEVQHCELVKISSCSALEIEAQFSELKIGKVDKLDGELEHCTSVIEQLTDALSIEASMGSLEVMNVAAGFSLIEIEQSMGEVNLTMDPKAGYKLTAEAVMGGISVPPGFKATKKDTGHDHEDLGSTVTGTAGDGKGTVNISVSMGSIKIK